HDLPDAAREWLGRFRAWLLIASAGWIVLVGGALYGPLLVIVIAMHVITSWSLIVAWLGTTLGGLFAAKSSSTNGKVEQKSNGGKVPLEILARVAPYVFLVGFLLLIAFGVHGLLVHN